ncbi:hypothetical protein EON65_07910 [archaeon]|nr:MAG: hypothetical protein EON65_07910 [archaeon]
MAGNKIICRSLDRLPIVLMAGITVEAVVFSMSEDGLADEQASTSAPSSVMPPWTLPPIQAQARWAVMQTIRKPRGAFNALFQVLAEGKGVGDGVLAIEANLLRQLPATRRRDSKDLRDNSKVTCSDTCRS